MLKDITIGQYFPGNSVIHRLDPRTKIVLTFFYIVLLFMAKNVLSMAVGLAFIAIAYAISRIPFRMVLKSIKPIIPIILFTAILNMFFLQGEHVLFSFWKITVSSESLWLAGIMALRIICLVVGTSLLTYTASPISLTDGIEQLLGPLKKIKVPVHELAMMMTIALRFIPTLIEETDKIISAQKARGADLESGGIGQRVKAMVPILIPLFVSSFRRAEELAMAMECRCYHGGEGRTRLKQLRFGTLDILAFGYAVVFFVLILLANRAMGAMIG